MIYENAAEAAAFLRSKYSGNVKRAVVLGSGLAAFAEQLQNPVKIPFSEIPHFARTTIEGHPGYLCFGTIEGTPIAVQQGRFHYYEGYDMEQVMFPIRVFGRIGVETVILTNAAGSLNPEMSPGSLMLISDHMNMTGVNPLRGANDERLGPRFPDMTEVYDPALQAIVVEEAGLIAQKRFESGKDEKFTEFLIRGVYCGLSGPTYETPAEIHVYRLLGADAVGMSTVPEAIAARHQGMKVIGISCITNFGAGMTTEPINHDQVMETTARAAEIFTELLRRVIRRISL